MNIFLRHGEVKNPKDILYYNIPGYELSKLGKSQAEHSAEVLSKDFKIEQIISSPLLRARQTSEIVSNKLKIEFSISEKITEWDGLLNWKGYTFDEIIETNEYLIYNDDPTKLSTNETFFETFVGVRKLFEAVHGGMKISCYFRKFLLFFGEVFPLLGFEGLIFEFEDNNKALRKFRVRLLPAVRPFRTSSTFSV